MKRLFIKIKRNVATIPLGDCICLGLLLVLIITSVTGITLALLGDGTFFALFQWALPLALSLFGLYLILTGKPTGFFKAGLLLLLLGLVVWPAWLLGGSGSIALLQCLLLLMLGFLILDNRAISWCIGGLCFGTAVAFLIVGLVFPQLAPQEQVGAVANNVLQILLLFGAAAVSLGLFMHSYVRQEMDLCDLEDTLEQAQMLDALTGAPNRKAIYTYMEQVAKEQTYYLARLDIDRFRRINDQYGCENGDLILQHVTKHIQSVAGAFGTFGRFGGDEFLLVLANASEMQVKAIGERLLWVPPNAILPISFSGGIIKSEPDIAPRVLLRQLERMVQDAKRKGRGRILLWDGQSLLMEEEWR